MEESPLLHLDLRAPLRYIEDKGLDPFYCPTEDDAQQETLFCFELNEEQAVRIDPEADHFLGKLLFSGSRENNEQGQQIGDFELAAGLYLFTQRRGALNKEECLYQVLEQQKDGLWEKLHLENRLFIRRLFEDGSGVTQLFRPYSR